MEVSPLATFGRVVMRLLTIRHRTSMTGYVRLWSNSRWRSEEVNARTQAGRSVPSPAFAVRHRFLPAVEAGRPYVERGAFITGQHPFGFPDNVVTDLRHGYRRPRRSDLEIMNHIAFQDVDNGFQFVDPMASGPWSMTVRQRSNLFAECSCLVQTAGTPSPTAVPI